MQMIKGDLDSAWSVIDTAVALPAVAHSQLQENRFTSTCVGRFWAVIMGVILEELVVSYAAVKKCSQEGREQMSLDASALYNYASDICVIQPFESVKDLKYVQDYLTCCKLEEPADVLAWVKKHQTEYKLDIVDSIVSNALARKLSKQAVKELRETINMMYQAMQWRV